MAGPPPPVARVSWAEGGGCGRGFAFLTADGRRGGRLRALRGQRRPRTAVPEHVALWAHPTPRAARWLPVTFPESTDGWFRPTSLRRRRPSLTEDGKRGPPLRMGPSTDARAATTEPDAAPFRDRRPEVSAHGGRSGQAAQMLLTKLTLRTTGGGAGVGWGLPCRRAGLPPHRRPESPFPPRDAPGVLLTNTPLYSLVYSGSQRRTF